MGLFLGVCSLDLANYCGISYGWCKCFRNVILIWCSICSISLLMIYMNVILPWSTWRCNTSSIVVSVLKGQLASLSSCQIPYLLQNLERRHPPGKPNLLLNFDWSHFWYQIWQQVCFVKLCLLSQPNQSLFPPLIRRRKNKYGVYYYVKTPNGWCNDIVNMKMSDLVITTSSIWDETILPTSLFYYGSHGVPIQGIGNHVGVCYMGFTPS